MNSIKLRAPRPEDGRPRLRVVIPLLVVCFGATFFLLRDILKPPSHDARLETASGLQPDPSITSDREAEQPRRFAVSNRFRKSTPISLAGPEDPVIESEGLPDTALPAVRVATVQTPVRTSATAPVQTITGSEIAGRITLKGNPPPEIDLPLDASCSRLRKVRPTTRFYLVDTDGGLADVFVYIKEGIKSKGGQRSLPPVLLDQIGCEYVPYVLGLQTGQKLLVRNSDMTTHNVHPTPMIEGNKESNRMQRQGAENLEFIFTKPEVFLRFTCNIHAWMFAYVGVVDHSFFAVSAHDGTFRIPNVPSGTYAIEAYHRKAGRSIQEIRVGDDERVEVEFIFELPNSVDATTYQPQIGSLKRGVK